MIHFRSLMVVVVVVFLALLASGVSACGGLFCQNVPVDQQAERIIFTMNDDQTISAYVQINYTGFAPDFSWVVPVPDVPDVDVAEIATFDELSTLTSPIFIAPQVPNCVPRPTEVAMVVSAPTVSSGVEVLAQGTAGPYAYEVVTSDDPDALVVWLRENHYQVTEDMIPLIQVYNSEGMVFLAMKLQPDQGVQDIQPVKMTYRSDDPMIPLRLTAVAANPNMNVLTWIFADSQAVPLNWAHPRIHDTDLRGSFSSFDSTNYLQLVDQTVDLYGGRAFITEYAQPTSLLAALGVVDAQIEEFVRDYGYVTRFFGRVSPEEMIVDPIFRLSENMLDVSNVHDLSGMKPETFWNCDATRINIQYDPSVVPEGFR